MSSEVLTPLALFMYLDDDYALPMGSLALSKRELIRRAWEEMRAEDRPNFQRELCRRIGNTELSFIERTRFIDIASIVRLDRQTRRLVRRQILDDVRALFRAQEVPVGAFSLGYVRRLRCLIEMGTVESHRFWRLSYQLCGSSCGLIVFTALHAREPDLALDWLTTYLSPWEQVRVLEKVMPAIRQRSNLGSVELVESALRAARTVGMSEEPQGHEWRERLLLFLNGSLNFEINRTGLMEFLRDTASYDMLPQIEKQEIHLRGAVDRLFEDWASRRLELELKPTLRLLMLTREFQSLRVLSSLVLYLEFLDRATLESTTGATRLTEAGSILDCFPWFDAAIERLARFSEGGDNLEGQRLCARVIAILVALRGKPLLSDRADRELVRHSRAKEDKVGALVSMLSRKEDNDWVEDLDRRMRGEFQGLIYAALQDYRLQPHLKNRLAKWCDDTYTVRDQLVAGSGWGADPYVTAYDQLIAGSESAADTYFSAALPAIAEARSGEELEKLVQLVEEYAL